MSASVLVVEDNPALRELLLGALTDEGYTVRGAENGQVALDMLDTWRPGVILLDLAMPTMDGLAFLGRLEAMPALATVPVIVVSAYANYLEAARYRGARAAIQKPYDVVQLLDTIAAVLHDARTDRSAE